MHSDTPALMKRELERKLSCNHVEQTQTNSLSLPVLSHTPPYILLRYSLEKQITHSFILGGVLGPPHEAD